VEDFGGFCPHFLGSAGGVASSSSAAGLEGVGRDAFVFGGVGEQQGEGFHDAGDGGDRETVAAEFFGPAFGFEVGDVGERRGAPAGEDMFVEEAAVVLFGALVNVEGFDPVGDPGGDGDLSCGGVDPGAFALLASISAM
jgi:hypothetical protein